jgi:hypothetical protein
MTYINDMLSYLTSEHKSIKSDWLTFELDI